MRGILYALFLVLNLQIADGQVTYTFHTAGDWTNPSNWNPSYPGTSLPSNPSGQITININARCVIPSGITVNTTSLCTITNQNATVEIKENGKFIYQQYYHNFDSLIIKANAEFSYLSCQHFSAFDNTKIINNGLFISEGLANMEADFYNYGELRNVGSYPFYVDYDGLFYNNGVLSGTGTYVTNTSNYTLGPNTIIKPGVNNAGSMNVQMWSCDPIVKYSCDINGPSVGQYDVLGGCLSIANSILDINWGFTPQVGNEFTIVSNKSGHFSQINIPPISGLNFVVVDPNTYGNVKIVVLSANQCLPNGITLSTQAEVDAFPTNYPGCAYIAGNLNISKSGTSTNITNLNALSQLTGIGGYLNVFNNANLTSLNGLHNIVTILNPSNFYDININKNNSLTNLNGFPFVSNSNVSVIINNNSNLTSLNGMNNTSLIDHDLAITNNPALPNLNGISQNITGNFTINSNNNLLSFSGLGNVTNLINCVVSNNANLNSISNLNSLIKCGEIQFYNLPKLQTITLSNLDSIKRISIYDNIILNSINTPSLNSFIKYSNGYNYCGVYNNPLLTSCNILQNITSTIPPSVYFKNNNLLNNLYISLDSILDFTIENNPNLNILSINKPSKINGTLIIKNTAISNLSNTNVCTLKGSLHMENNSQLVNLNGLDIVGPIGYFNIINNDLLSSLTPLNNVKITESINISNNALLSNINGLNNSNSISDLNISNNASLSSLMGLSNLANLSTSLTLTDNPILPNLNGLDNLLNLGDPQNYTGTINISNNNSLLNLNAFNTNINTHLYALYIKNNPLLSSVSALKNQNNMNYFENIEIENNNSLTSLNGIYSSSDNYAENYGNFKIINNDALTSIIAVDSIMNWGTVDITGNANLSNCSVWAICNLITQCGGGCPISINNNLSNCDSIPVVATQCSIIPTCDSLTIPTVSNITTNSVKVSWASLPNALNYTLDYKPSTTNSWVKILYLQDTTFTIQNLLPGASYDLRVFVECTSGSSPASPVATFNTPSVPIEILYQDTTIIKLKYYQPIDITTANSTNIKISGSQSGQKSCIFGTFKDTLIITSSSKFISGETINITSTSNVKSLINQSFISSVFILPSKTTNVTNGHFEPIGTGIILPSWINENGFDCTMADMNKDGRLDLIIRHQYYNYSQTNILIYLKNADGTFASPSLRTTSSAYSSLSGTNDINGDGYPDLILNINSPSSIQVWFNDGLGAVNLHATYPVTNYSNGAKIFDADNDGDLDIMSYSGNSSLALNSLSLLKNNGNGTFSPQITTNTNVFGTSLLPLDTDIDGDMDVLYTSNNAFNSEQTFRVYKNNVGSYVQSYSENNSTNKILADVLDIDNDNSPDILVNSPSTEIYKAIVLNNYSLNTSTPIVVHPQISISSFADIDGDQDRDVFIANHEVNGNFTTPLKIAYNSGLGAFNAIFDSSFVTTPISKLGLYDFDSDGDLDHLYRMGPDINVALNDCHISKKINTLNSSLKGTYRAIEEINITGANFIVAQNEKVILEANKTKLSGSLNCNLAANIIVRKGACNDVVQKASVSNLNCGNATHIEILISNLSASGVSSIIPYTGGNGRSYPSQSINSTGVTGLTATLNGGTTAIGDGSLIFTITGIPSNVGTANFNINFGGQECTISRTVLPLGAISNLNCGNSTNIGFLVGGYNIGPNVYSILPYSGGNGGYYPTMTIVSTGVTGLIATITSDSFANGSGNLTLALTGTPSSAGTATFYVNIGGQTCSFSRLIMGTVVNPTTGKTWLDRNLGASSTASQNLTDSYGDLYQWGRINDGHELKTSDTTSMMSNTNTPPHNKFIITSVSPWDWRNPQNSGLWNGATGINNPCPSGFRLPDSAEWNAEKATWSSANTTGALNSILQLPPAGYRTVGGVVMAQGSLDYYWTSVANSGVSFILWVTASQAVVSSIYRGNGASVRCIKN